MAQIDGAPDLLSLPANKLHSSSSTQARMIAEVVRCVDGTERAADIVVFPEVTVPFECREVLRQVAEEYRVTLLVGLTWRRLPFAKDPTGATVQTEYWFANEAALVLPSPEKEPGIGPELHLIRKPRPNLDEIALARILSDEHSIWRLLRGSTWSLFDHSSWGPFAVAICSDALDPGALAKLGGRVLHLFVCCMNRDIELFEAMTWTRAYELFANVVAVNHGIYGGSFAWSPRHEHKKEVARIRGAGLRIIADVNLPVKSLDAVQRAGTKAGVFQAMAKTWRVDTGAQNSEFKAIPPHYRPRPG
jgi:hypothetical protein